MDVNRSQRWWTLALAGSLLACTEGFAPSSEISGLRVLAVQPEPASGVPGQMVRLNMLLHDGRARRTSASEAPPEPQVLWIGGCHNPPSTQFFDCYAPLRALAERLGPSGGEFDDLMPVPDLLGIGREFEFTVPQDILVSAPRSDTYPVHFGVSYIFFAACAGELRLNSDKPSGLPLSCHDPDSGERLGPQDFVEGFTTLYSYEDDVNSNPTLQALRFAGAPVSLGECEDDGDCDGARSAAEGFARFACGSEGTCVPEVDRCAPEQDSHCPAYEIFPEIPESSAEPDPTAAREDSEFPGEILWTNFYADAGEFSSDTRLVHDRQSGWVEQRASRWRPLDSEAVSVRLFVTLHDNRGGASWQSFEVVLREP